MVCYRLATTSVRGPIFSPEITPISDGIQYRFDASASHLPTDFVSCGRTTEELKDFETNNNYYSILAGQAPTGSWAEYRRSIRYIAELL